jgi:hypothetical protein
MSVDLIWTYEGDVISAVDMGNFFSSSPDPLEVALVLSHNGDAAITSVQVYIDTILTKDYTGSNTPLKDIAETLAVLQINTGSGYSLFSATGLSGAKTIGTINSGATKNIGLKISSITTGNLGYHNFELKTKYTWTV